MTEYIEIKSRITAQCLYQPARKIPVIDSFDMDDFLLNAPGVPNFNFIKNLYQPWRG